MPNLTWKTVGAVSEGFVADASNKAFTSTALAADNHLLESHITGVNTSSNHLNLAAAKAEAELILVEKAIPLEGTVTNG